MRIIISFIFYFLVIFPFQILLADEFVMLKNNKVNVRYGPSFDSPVKFIYKKVNLPIRQIDKKENWRRIIDLKNNSGWIHRSQLKKINSIMPLKDKILSSKRIIELFFFNWDQCIHPLLFLESIILLQFSFLSICFIGK